MAAGDLWLAGSAPDGIYKSTDGGANWGGLIAGPSGQTNVSGVAIDPRNDDIWLAGDVPDGIYKSTDGGANWGSLISPPSGQTSVLGIAVDSRNGDLWLAGSAPDGIYKSTDGGANWGSRISPPSGQTSVHGIAVDPRNGDLWLAGSTPDGIYKSTDGGANWGSRISPPSGQTAVTGIAVDSRNGDLWLTGAIPDGIYKSTDGGANWGSRISPPSGQTIVTDIDIEGAAATLTATITGETTRTTGQAASYSATLGGTATGAATYQWQWRSGTSGAWTDGATTATYSLTQSSAGTWQVRLQVTRDGVSDTSNVITTVWSAPALPVAVAPTVSIDSIAAGDEGTSTTLTATVAGGTYDGSITYAWSVDEGTLNDATAASPTWTRPSVTATKNVDVNLRITVSGTGTNARTGTSASRDATEVSASVRNVAAPTVTVAVSVDDAAPQTGETVTWSRTVGGTATGAITQQWQRRAGTTGAWSNVGTGTTYATSRASAGTWYVRCVVTRQGVSATSTAVLATWTAPLPVAVAPTVSINAVAAGDEGTTVTLGASVGAGGQYDGSVTYAWTVSGGTLNDATAAAPVWTRPTVATNTDFDIDLRITVSGDGTTTRNGTSANRDATQVSATVRNVPDTTAPVLQSVATNAAGTLISLTYNEALSNTSIPAAGDFTFAPAKTISVFSVAGSVVTLSVSTAFIAGETITLDYAVGTNPIQDVEGNDAASFSGEAVTNNVPLPYQVFDLNADEYLVGSVSKRWLKNPRPLVNANLCPAGQTRYLDLVVARREADRGGVFHFEPASFGTRTSGHDLSAQVESAGIFRITVGDTHFDFPVSADTGSNEPYVIDFSGNTQTAYNAWQTALSTTEGDEAGTFTIWNGLQPSPFVDAVRVAGIGATAVGGASALTVTPAGTRISGIGATAVGGASALTVRRSSGVLVSGIGATAVGGASALVVFTPDRTAPSFVSAETRADGLAIFLTFDEALLGGALPDATLFDVQVAGAARAVASGGVSISDSTVTLILSSAVEAGDTVTVAYTQTDVINALDLRDAEGNRVKSFTAQAVTNNVRGNNDLVRITLTDLWNNTSEENWWREIDGVDASLIRQDTDATIFVYAYNYGGGDPLRSVTAVLPQLTADIERRAGDIVYETADGAELLRFDFPSYSPFGASENGYASPDQNAATMATFLAYTGHLLFRVTLNAVPVRIVGIGSTAVGGDAALAVTPPTAVRVTGVGATAVGGDTTLVVSRVPAVRVAGIGSTAVGGDAAIAVTTPAAAVVSGVGATAVGGGAALSVVVPGATRVAGIGSTAVGGGAALAVTSVPAVRVAGIGSTAVGGGSALSVVAPGATRVAGIGSTAVGGDSSLLVVVPGATRVTGIGSTAVGGDAALAVTAPTAVRVAGIGSTAVGGGSALSVVVPGATRVAGIGSTAVGGDSDLDVGAPVRIAGVGATAVGGQSGLTVVRPAAARVAGIGSTAVGGVADISVSRVPAVRIAGVGSTAVGALSGLGVDSALNFLPLTFTLAPDGGNSWREATGTVPISILEGDLSASETLRVTLHGRSGSRVLRVRTVESADFLPAIEASAHVALYDSSNTLLVDTDFGGDTARPYNIGISNAEYDAIAAEAANTITAFLHAPEGVRVEGIGDTAVGGASALAVTHPTAVRISGVGATAVGGVSTLVVASVPAVRVAGVGTTAVGGGAAIAVTSVPAVRVAGIGSTAVGGGSVLSVVAPGATRVAGIGSTAVGGAAALAVTAPTTVRVAGVGSTAVGGGAALSVVVPGATRITGIGSTAVGGAAALTVTPPTAVRVAGIGSTAVGGAAALSVVAPGATRVAGIGSTVVGGASVLAVTAPTTVRVAGVGATAVGGASALSVVSSDTTAPVLQSVATDETGALVLLTYSEALSNTSIPAPGDFTFAPAKTISVFSVAGSVVTLSVSPAFIAGETITLDYAVGTNPIQDVGGNDAAAFSGEAVTNNVPLPYQVFDLDADEYLVGSVSKRWLKNPRPLVNANLSPTGQTRYLDLVVARREADRGGVFHFEPGVFGTRTDGHDLSAQVESAGIFRITVGDTHFDFPASADTGTDEPYVIDFSGDTQTAYNTWQTALSATAGDEAGTFTIWNGLQPSPFVDAVRVAGIGATAVGGASALVVTPSVPASTDLVRITLTDIFNDSSTDKWWREPGGVPASLIRQDTDGDIFVYAYRYTGNIDPLLATHVEMPQLTADIERRAGDIVYETTDGTELLRFDFPIYSPDVISPGYASPDQTAETMATFLAYDGDLVFRVTLGVSPVRIIGVGTTAVGGASAIVVAPPIRVTGVGDTAVGGVSDLSVVRPAAARVAGIGLTTVGGVSGIAVSRVPAVRIAGVGSTAVGASSGVGVTSALAFLPLTFTLAPDGGNSWREATGTVPISILEGDLSASETLRVTLHGNAGSRVLRVRTVESTDFLPAIEASAHIALYDSSNTLLVDTDFGGDTARPYNIGISNAEYDAIAAEAANTITAFLHAPEGVRLGGVGATAVGGASALAVTAPTAARVTGVGDTAVGGASALVVGTQIRITGTGTTPVGADSDLTVTGVPAVRIRGIGSTAVGGTVRLVVAQRVSVRGIGSTAVGGGAALVVTEPQPIDDIDDYTRGQAADLQGEVPKLALEISHPDITTPIRIVADNTAHTIEGNNYIALAFRGAPPQVREGEAPRAQFEVDNVGREMIEWIELTGGGRGASARVLLVHFDPVADASFISWELPAVSVGVTEISNETISFTMVFRSGRSRPGIKMRADPTVSPGIF